jgi:hypothetical protein
MLWCEKKGMRFDSGTAVIVGASCTNAGLSRGDCRADVAGLSIAKVIPDVLFIVLRWCVCGVAWITTGAVGFIVAVTGGAGPTFCPWGTPSEVGG